MPPHPFNSISITIIVIIIFKTYLGYQTYYVPLHKDISSRDLLQRRSTNSDGDTIWGNSPLVCLNFFWGVEN